MEEILHQLICSLTHYLQGFVLVGNENRSRKHLNQELILLHAALLLPQCLQQLNPEVIDFQRPPAAPTEQRNNPGTITKQRVSSGTRPSNSTGLKPYDCGFYCFQKGGDGASSVELALDFIVSRKGGHAVTPTGPAGTGSSPKQHRQRRCTKGNLKPYQVAIDFGFHCFQKHEWTSRNW